MGAEDKEVLVKKEGEEDEDRQMGPPAGFGGTGKFAVTFEDVSSMSVYDSSWQPVCCNLAHLRMRRFGISCQ